MPLHSFVYSCCLPNTITLDQYIQFAIISWLTQEKFMKAVSHISDLLIYELSNNMDFNAIHEKTHLYDNAYCTKASIYLPLSSKHVSKCVLWITYCNLSLTHCFCLKFESQIVKSLPCKCHFSNKAALCTEFYRKQPVGALYCFLQKTEQEKKMAL